MSTTPTNMNEDTTKVKVMLEQLVQSMGISIKEYTEGGFLDLTTYGRDKASIISRLDAIDIVDSSDNAETLSEKIIAINEVLSNDQGELQGILDLISSNTNAITNLTNIANVRYDSIVDRQNVQDQRLTDNTSAIAVNAAAINALQNATGQDLTLLSDRVGVAEALLDTLRGNSSVSGSVANSVLAEENRAKAVSGLLADLNTTDKSTIVAAINEVRDQVLANASSVNDLQVLAGQGADALAQEVQDRAAADTALETQIATIDGLLSDLTSALATETQARVDGDTNNAAAIAAEADRAIGAEQALQDAIDAISGNGYGSLGDIENRVTEIEDEINDTTDENDNIVKGLKSKVLDNSNAIAALDQSIRNGLSDGIQEAKDYSDAKAIKADEIDVCGIGNIFRTALGLGTNQCDDYVDGGDGDGAIL